MTCSKFVSVDLGVNKLIIGETERNFRLTWLLLPWLLSRNFVWGGGGGGGVLNIKYRPHGFAVEGVGGKCASSCTEHKWCTETMAFLVQTDFCGVGIFLERMLSYSSFGAVTKSFEA